MSETGELSDTLSTCLHAPANQYGPRSDGLHTCQSKDMQSNHAFFPGLTLAPADMTSHVLSVQNSSSVLYRMLMAL